MKHLVAAAGLLLMQSACQSPQSEGAAENNLATLQAELPATYGDTIETDGALSVRQVPSLLQNTDSTYVTLSGTVINSCAKKGCWMNVAVGGGEQMRVTFKDYGFFVPKDLQGEDVVMEGVLKRKVSSVEEQRHFAEDAGKSAAEIAAIQQADTIYSFEAVGVTIWPGQPQ